MSVDDQDHRLIAIKTSQSITLVLFKDTEFQEHKKLPLEHPLFEESIISYFTFKKETFNTKSPPSMVVGFKNGLVAHVGCNNKKVLGFYNHDDKNKAAYTHKNQLVSFIAAVPETNGNEVLVLFADSTIMKYQLSLKSSNTPFIEKIKRFEQKTNFQEHLNRFKYNQKKKNTWSYGSLLNNNSPEFRLFYAHNDSFPLENPLSYWKFNHRTITALAVQRHESFSRTLFNDKNIKEATVFAFVSLDGFLVIYEYYKMTPKLSYKTSFGGINSLVFSENCELVAMGGQDDCITVLDLKTKQTLRCEGHKSFVTRVIFQTIPYRKVIDQHLVDKITKKTSQENKEACEIIRIIGGSMDGSLSFFEFNKNVFKPDREETFEEREGIWKLTQEKLTNSIKLKPISIHRSEYAIGWIEILENMLFKSDCSGGVSVYIIKDLAANKDLKELLPLKKRKSTKEFEPENSMNQSQFREEAWLKMKKDQNSRPIREENVEADIGDRMRNFEEDDDANANSPSSTRARMKASLLNKKKDADEQNFSQ